MSVAEINGLIKEFKRARYNVVKPGTDELFSESIDFFKKDEFKTVLEKHPEVKKMILQFIQEGKFYTLKEIVEDNPNVEETTDKVEVVNKDVIEEEVKTIEQSTEQQKVVDEKTIVEEQQLVKGKRRKIS
jgi:hypothetical protein